MYMRPTLITTILCTSLLTACTEKIQVTYPLPTASSSAASPQESIATAPTSSAATTHSATTQTTSEPSSVRIDVPFATQAPLTNWDALHQEACEEASLILVKRYLNGDAITPQQMEDEIQTLVKWETDNGYGIDVTIQEISDVAKKVYGLNGTVITDVTVARIKKEIAAGHPIIIPAAGRMLGNPNFTGLGPPYHMLVIIGYDSKNFITNDVGTRKGAGYIYSYDTIINAIHDWNGSVDTIQSGRKAMLVLSK
jgi:uncharacterized protein YvpB